MTRALGIAANLLGIGCTVVAPVKYKTTDVVLFGAPDRPGVVVDQPSLTGWLIAAMALTAAGTALLIRR